MLTFRNTFERNIALSKCLVFPLCIWPFLLLVWDAMHGRLGADPVNALIHRSGWWALLMLMLSLSMTPLRRITGKPWWIRFRRLLGLYAFFYACIHFSSYLLDRGARWDDIWKDVFKRPYITVGFSAFILLIPLAITSTKGMMRRLGSRWQKLHKSVYVIAILGVVHFWWQVKADIRQPLTFAIILAVLLAFRIFKKKSNSALQTNSRR
jgi:methionine sulfoxide reductase heme-binding subunit